jgi:hypothetical protein
MGIFSKRKSTYASSVSEESLLVVISRFQKMIPDDFKMEKIPDGFTYGTEDGSYDASFLRQIVDDLTRVAYLNDDQQLLHFVEGCCVFASEEFGRLEIAKIAETLFDDFVVYKETRGRFSWHEQLADDVVTLSFASISLFQKNPKYPEVLRYLSDNAEKFRNR